MEKERERKRDKAENPLLVGRPAGWKKEVEEESRGQGGASEGRREAGGLVAQAQAQAQAPGNPRKPV